MTNIGAVVTNPLPADMALPDIAGLAQQAESLGLDCFWVEDGPPGGDAPGLDCTLALAAAAAVTRDIEVGLGVFVPSLRPLAWAAKQIATLQHIAGGNRLQVGVGLGGGSDEEYQAAGSVGSDRRSRTDQFLQSLPALLQGREVCIAEGPRSPVLSVRPAVPVPPLWVGGTSLAALRRAVRFGDGWLAAFQTPQEFKASVRRLAELAGQDGRPCPRAAVVAQVAIGTRPARELAGMSIEAMRSAYGVPPERAEELAIVGTPAEVADQLAGYVDAGAERIAVISDVLPWSESWHLVAEAGRLLNGR